MEKKKKKAPSFRLKGIDGSGEEREFALKDFLGQKVLLYFYPRDNTPGCTTEACDFQSNLQNLSAYGYVVVGVSPDSVESHKKFQEKHGLQFILLSDPEKKVAQKYGAYGTKKRYGREVEGIIRSTFAIDEKGKIEKMWINVRAKGHVERILRELKSETE